jgi:hypothetical protein
MDAKPFRKEPPSRAEPAAEHIVISPERPLQIEVGHVLKAVRLDVRKVCDVSSQRLHKHDLADPYNSRDRSEPDPCAPRAVRRNDLTRHQQRSIFQPDERANRSRPGSFRWWRVEANREHAR